VAPRYRRTRSASNQKQRKASRGRQPRIVGRDEELTDRVAVELPVSLAEVIDGVSEEIERLAGAAGLLIMREVMEAEAASLAGPKGMHDPQREAFRWGHQGGYAVLGGTKVKLEHPRVRTRDGREVTLRSYERFQSPPTEHCQEARSRDQHAQVPEGRRGIHRGLRHQQECREP